YQGQTALLRATISADTASYRRAAERCADLGIRIPSHAADPWGLVPALVEPALQSRVASVAGRALRIDMLDGLRVMLDGKEASEQLWQRRRKSQVLLALLLASDGRVGRNELVEALWGGEVLDAATGQSRLSTVLSSLRRALPGTLATTEVGARVLKLHANQVELQLADTDVTDRMMLRELVSMVASEDPRDHRALARRAAEMITLVQGEPLRGLDGGLALSDAQEALRHEMATACVDVADRWLRAAAESVAPPGQLLELAGHASRLQPLDERMAAVHVELWARAGRIGEASQAFHRFRDVLDRELGLPPSAQLVRRHAQLVMNA
ncbi:MAG: putative AfsR-family transcriptional regulator, partial [Thermoleophilia bacterium]|nr:putative AfsR-family transcriptional regulator [Thermoleophilia bacterium]